MWWDYEADMKRNAREEGRREGIKISIDISREDGKTRGETAARIQEKFALSEEETVHYMDTFWTE